LNLATDWIKPVVAEMIHLIKPEPCQPAAVALGSMIDLGLGLSED
jgi:hypothetical protein